MNVVRIRLRELADGMQHARLVASSMKHDLHPFKLSDDYSASSACRKCGASIVVRTIAAVPGTIEDDDGGWTWEIVGHAQEDECDVLPFRPRELGNGERRIGGKVMYSAAWLAAVSLAAVGAFLAPARASAASSFPTFDRVASSIAGRPVQIVCDTSAEWAVDLSHGVGLAFTAFRGETPLYTHLGPIACRGLLLASADTSRARAALLRRLNPSVDVTLAEGMGIGALVHESEHLAGIRDESAACRAAKGELPYAVRELVGYAPDRAAALDAARMIQRATVIAIGWTC